MAWLMDCSVCGKTFHVAGSRDCPQPSATTRAIYYHCKSEHGFSFEEAYSAAGASPLYNEDQY